MTYFPDLSPCDYHSGPFDSGNWKCDLLAVGWLEKDYEYPTGDVPTWLIDKIEHLRISTRETFPNFWFRGLHGCSFSSGELYLEDSYINLFIPGDKCVYLAPGRIDHYVKNLNYKPPEAFILAMEKCPDPSSQEYVDKLKAVNLGEIPPLFE